MTSEPVPYQYHHQQQQHPGSVSYANSIPPNIRQVSSGQIPNMTSQYQGDTAGIGPTSNSYHNSETFSQPPLLLPVQQNQQAAPFTTGLPPPPPPTMFNLGGNIHGANPHQMPPPPPQSLPQSQSQQQQYPMGGLPPTQNYSNNLIPDVPSTFQQFPSTMQIGANPPSGLGQQFSSNYASYYSHDPQFSQFPNRDNSYVSTSSNTASSSFSMQNSNPSSSSAPMYLSSASAGSTLDNSNSNSNNGSMINSSEGPSSGLPLPPVLQSVHNQSQPTASFTTGSSSMNPRSLNDQFSYSYNYNNNSNNNNTYNSFHLKPNPNPTPPTFSADSPQYADSQINSNKLLAPMSYPFQQHQSSLSHQPPASQLLAPPPPPQPRTIVTTPTTTVKPTRRRRVTTRTDRPTEFPCPHCSKVFEKSYNLKSHLKIHSDEKPFSCKHCQRCFARNHDRKRHELLHEDVKKYTCGSTFDNVSTKPEISSSNGAQLDIFNPLSSSANGNSPRWGCGKKFSRVDGLVRHYKTEMGFICVKPLLQQIKIMYSNNPAGTNNAVGLTGYGVDPTLWNDYQELLANLGLQMIYGLINRMDSYAALM